MRIKYYNLIILLLFLTAQGTGAGSSIQRFEAEAGQFMDMSKLQDTTASGGEYLSMKDTGQVIWNVIVAENGYYNITIRYRAEGGEKEQFFIKNGVLIPVGFAVTPDWRIFSQSFYLESGSNQLGLKKSWGYMDIDWISVQATRVMPKMIPGRLRFYTQSPCNLAIKIENYHQTIRNIFLDEQPLAFEVKSYPYQESAVWVKFPPSCFIHQSEGMHTLKVLLDSSEITGSLAISPTPAPAALTIIAPDVSHGASVLFRLPGGKNMLIDCGQAWVRDSILIPMFRRHEIDTIHTFILTHYDNDHDSGDRGKTILEKFHVKNLIDYKTYSTGYEWEQDSISLKILNSFADGYDENTCSLAIKITFRDFIYMHGGDIYAMNQRRIINRFLKDIPAYVFHANHHFHGSVDAQYIRITNPDLVIIQAQEAIYARSAYMEKYKKEVEDILNKRREHPVETLPALEVGTIVIRVNNAEDWWYETYIDQDMLIIPGIVPDRE
jgi:competence protein ComEC